MFGTRTFIDNAQCLFIAPGNINTDTVYRHMLIIAKGVHGVPAYEQSIVKPANHLEDGQEP